MFESMGESWSNPIIIVIMLVNVILLIYIVSKLRSEKFDDGPLADGTVRMYFLDGCSACTTDGPNFSTLSESIPELKFEWVDGLTYPTAINQFPTYVLKSFTGKTFIKVGGFGSAAAMQNWISGNMGPIPASKKVLKKISPAAGVNVAPATSALKIPNSTTTASSTAATLTTSGSV